MIKKQLLNNLFFLENKDFQTIQIQVVFPFKDDIQYLAKGALLSNMLNYMNNYYDTEEVFQKEKRKRLILQMGSTKFSIGDKGYFCFDLIIPDTFVLEDNLLEEQISFFEKMIYHPKLIDDAFDNFELEREKTNLKRAMNNSMKNLRPYHHYRIRKLIDDQGQLSISLYDNMPLIDDVTVTNLYSFYQELISNNEPLIFIMGNIDKEMISNLITKYLIKKPFSQKIIDVDYNSFLKPRMSKVQEIEEKGDFKDSAFSLVYKVKNMQDEDILLLQSIRGLLASLSSRLLDKKLRNDFDLVYSTHVNIYAHYGVLELTAYINKNNKELVKEKMLEVIDDLKKEELIAPLFANFVDRQRVNLIRRLDQKRMLFDDFIDNILGIDELPEEKYKKLKQIKAKDLVNFMNRLVLDTIYFLKEEENE